MRTLSQECDDTLQALQERMKNTLPTPQPGSTAVAGTTNMAPREVPLNERQLASIASRMLLGPLQVIWNDRIIYGRKNFSDEFGEFCGGDHPIAKEKIFSVTAYCRDDLSERLIDAAWRLSAAKAYVFILARLAMHKHIGVTQEEKAIKLRDYAEALEGYPEFIVWAACKWFRECDPGHFFPKIVEISMLCDKIAEALPGSSLRQPIFAEIARYKKPPRGVKIDPRENPLRKNICAFIVSKGGDDHFDDIMFWPNYSLEIVAKAKYGWRDDTSPSTSEPS